MARLRWLAQYCPVPTVAQFARAADPEQACLPITPDPVVTHGDFSLENIRLQEGAVVWRALGELDAARQQRFVQQYGILDADQGKLQFYLLLDELF
ncbi:hypothetical protein [Janthinobacterium sp. LB3P112]|uniref:hypothetical protein n=1 Tax=Janthinobacterium sp. LB3P112 TaxID=3424196 RepID=UPI003F293EBE